MYSAGACERADEIIFKLWKYNVRVDGYGLFSWLSDVHGVGMASGAVVGLVKVYFMGRVFV